MRRKSLRCSFKIYSMHSIGYFPCHFQIWILKETNPTKDCTTKAMKLFKVKLKNWSKCKMASPKYFQNKYKIQVFYNLWWKSLLFQRLTEHINTASPEKEKSRKYSHLHAIISMKKMVKIYFACIYLQEKIGVNLIFMQSSQ